MFQKTLFILSLTLLPYMAAHASSETLDVHALPDQVRGSGLASNFGVSGEDARNEIIEEAESLAIENAEVQCGSAVQPIGSFSRSVRHLCGQFFEARVTADFICLR